MTFRLRFSRFPATCLFASSSTQPGLIFNRSNKFDFRALSGSKAERIQIPKKRRRLDEICLERFQQYSRTYIQSWIMQGLLAHHQRFNPRIVLVDSTCIVLAKFLLMAKSSTKLVHLSDKSVVEIKAVIPKYVCRAGHKLEAALKECNVDCVGKIVLDSGLSTGGFTDCLLQNGASHVYGVDVGYGQVAEKIRTDERVTIIERTNLRYLQELPQNVDLVMPAVVNLMKMESTLITLVKPQFEAHRSQVGGGGIVRDPQVHQEVLERIIKGVEEFGFKNEGWIESPIKGAEGNIEFLAYFHRVPMAQ